MKAQPSEYEKMRAERLATERALRPLQEQHRRPLLGANNLRGLPRELYKAPAVLADATPYKVRGDKRPMRLRRGPFRPRQDSTLAPTPNTAGADARAAAAEAARAHNRARRLFLEGAGRFQKYRWRW